MPSKNDVLRQQRRWAETLGIEVDARGYVRAPADNLRAPLSEGAAAQFANGSELTPGATRPARMWSLTSSAALVANFFDPWTRGSAQPLLRALGIDAASSRVSFEAPFATGLEGDPPNVDVALELPTGLVVTIESKFTEWLKPRPRNRAAFKAKYFPPGVDLWARHALPESQVLASELQRHAERFKFLHAAQLLKHALGLATQVADKFSIYYLYYDVPGPVSRLHRAEIERFAARVGTELRFKALSYQEVFRALSAADDVDRDYLDYLRRRYFPGCVVELPTARASVPV